MTYQWRMKMVVIKKAAMCGVLNIKKKQDTKMLNLSTQARFSVNAKVIFLLYGIGRRYW